MDHYNRSQRTAAFATALALGCTLAGCRHTPAVDDPALTAQVQQRIANDGGLTNEPVQVMAQAGTVTLTGTVSNNAARALAADDAAGITGVKKVINDITVNSATGPATTTTTPLVQPAPEAPPARRERVGSTTATLPRNEQAQPPAPVTRTTPEPAPGPAPVAAQPATPPPPVARVVTLPAGTTVPVRITQTLDSGTAQPGDSFSGAVATDIVQDGMLLIPRGSTVTGRVTEVHEAAHFKGSALLTVELTGLNVKGERLSVSTQPYTSEGKGRGKNTAEKTGIGAAAGAVLGGIFGGGKGAAIGAAAGGGTGAGINAVTRGQQVQIASESVIRFTTTNSLAVRTSTRARGQSDEPSLQNRDQ